MRAPNTVWTAIAWLLAACGTAPEVTPMEGVTWHRDVRPVFERHCTSCHADGGVAPFRLDHHAADWADGVPAWAAASAASVASGSMPPWMPDMSDCAPLDAPRVMPEADKALVAAWADAGFPEGDAADYVPPDLPAAEVLPEPTAVLKSPAPYVAKLDKPDDYRCFALDVPEDAGLYMRGYDIVPDQVELVHHVILYRLDARHAGLVAELEARDPEPGYTCFGSPGTWDADTLAAWAPGQRAELLPAGMGRYIPAGSKLVIQVHYSVVGRTEPPPADQSEVHLFMYPRGEAPSELVISIPFTDTRFELEPGVADITVTQSESLDFIPSIPGLTPIRTVGVMPHMHQLGTRIGAWIDRADGSSDCLVDIPEWDFNWQQAYFFDWNTRVAAHPEDAVRIECGYDNSAENQPIVNGVQQEPRTVRWGDSTQDEMCLVYFMAVGPRLILENIWY